MSAASMASKALATPRLTDWQRDFLSVVVSQSQPLTHTQSVLLRRVAKETGVGL